MCFPFEIISANKNQIKSNQISPTGIAHLTAGLANVDGYHLPHSTFEQLPFFKKQLPFFDFLMCQLLQESLFLPLSGKPKFAELSTGSYAPPPHHWSPYFWQLEARGDWKAYPTFPSGAVSVLCGNQNLLRGVNYQCDEKCIC